jgi:thiol-disulfide isomerase/thioredoxin
MEQLRGRIGLLDFWDFTCINCLRTLPYKREWHAKYREMGLQILGIHTPEFDFARQEDVLRAAVGRLGIPWPVILDNDQSLWTSFANSVWPTVYLLDLDTKIRFRQEGEGHYGEIERSIQSLLVELDPSLDLPVISNPAAPEAAPGTACSPVTPELQLDSIHGLDNQSSRIQVFHLPEDRREGRTYLTGRWSIASDGIAAAEKGCSITLTYSAGSCYTVLSPSPGAEPESALPSVSPR